GYDNPSVYNGGANARTNVYYDTSVLVAYDQPYTQKPAVIGHAYGKISDFLLYGDLITEIKYDGSIWFRQTRTEDNAYYPQLRVFAFNQDAEIKVDSIQSTIKDVSGGLGTQGDPFLIKSADDMHELSRMVNEGNNYKNYYFKVDDNINELDLGNFIPIGTTTNYFQGTFNGNGVNFVVNIDTTNSQ